MEIDDALLWHCLRRVVPFTHADYRDYAQEARLARWVHRDLPKGVQYGAIYRDLIDIRRQIDGRSEERRAGLKRLGYAVSLDKMWVTGPREYRPLSDIIPDQRDEIAEWEDAQHGRDCWRLLLGSCTNERERLMLRQRRKGWRLMQIAHAHGISESLVSRLLKRIGQRAA